ncbi:MAG: MATE family efflux transporter [Mailhella sp.]|nr:MATE family efflux transporter [Mailhella sp.]
MEKDLTTGSIGKAIVSFSLPYLLSYFLQTLYGMADLFIIGRFNGVESTTAVAIGSQVMHMLTVMIVGLAMGSTILIGRATGAKDAPGTRQAVGNTAVLFTALSLVMTVVLLASAHLIVSVMKTPADAVPGTLRYLTICFLGIPFITAYNIISSVFRGMGDTKSPMIFIAVACFFNILLDFFFIGALGLDAAGAALGTTVSQAASVAFSLYAIRRRNMIPGLGKADFRPSGPVMKKILKVGFPVAVQDGFIQIAFLAITVFANLRGLSDSAAVGIVEKQISFIFLVPSSMLSAVAVLAAQNIGAGKHERARLALWYATGIAVIYGLAVSVIFQFIAEPAVAVFVDASANAAEVVRLGGQYMRGYIWDCIFAGVHFCFSGYFCAYGLSNISFLHNFISVVFARVPLAYFAARCFTATLFPMGLAAPAGSLLSIVICLAAYCWMRRHPETL